MLPLGQLVGSERDKLIFFFEVDPCHHQVFLKCLATLEVVLLGVSFGLNNRGLRYHDSIDPLDGE